MSLVGYGLKNRSFGVAIINFETWIILLPCLAKDTAKQLAIASSHEDEGFIII